MTIREAMKKGLLKDFDSITETVPLRLLMESIGECATCWGGAFVKRDADGYIVSVYAYKGALPIKDKAIIKLK